MSHIGGHLPPAAILRKKKKDEDFIAAQQRPQWQPLSRLPLLGQHLDGMLEASREQYAILQEAQPKPSVLDRAIVDRVIRDFTTQQETLVLFDEQFKRWSEEPALTQKQRAEILRQQQRMTELHQVNTDVLALAGELRKGTIETILEMDGAELGLRFLLGKMPGQEMQ